MNMTAAMEARTNKPLTACTDQEIYLALLDIVRKQSAARVRPVTGRKLYYISAEFLIGKLLSNNLINLGLYDDTRAALAAAGKNLSDIEEVEPEPSLGNGGLGRLAACFLDSLATLNLPGDGVGLRYHFGLFHQSFKDGIQNELPDPWLTAHSWAEKNGYGLSRRTGRQDLQRPSVQAGRHGLRGPHEHAESVRSRHH